ncbi:MAG: hypothetical protein DCC73_11465 [Proteobacteria bacterium]|nr:MAG: hypothetical protein DCC73_11465 [Pseudomonadota bacterium]
MRLLAQKPAGPVADRFVKSQAYLRGIMGPIGSGKTTACIQACVWAALWQNPGPDGVRRARVVVVRDTYPNLDTTTLRSWHGWFPKELGRWNGDAPRIHEIRFALHREWDVELEMVFVAVGDKRAEDIFRGLEPTAVWLNEADLLSPEVFQYARTRVGRYPGPNLGGCAWSGLWCDFNAPDIDNYIYETFVENPGPETVFFRQPGGFDPQAENIHNLPARYYERQAEGMPDDKKRRLIDNQFGFSRDGQPVYPEFQDHIHVANRPLEPIKGLKLIIGLDGGMTPAAVFCQRTSIGQWRCLAELAVFPTAEKMLDAMGPTRFAEVLRQKLRDDYADWYARPESIELWADPATDAGNDEKGGDESWLRIVQRVLGLSIRRAATNDPTLRQEAVRRTLPHSVEGQPAFLLSPVCKVVRKGFNSGYHIRRIAVAGSNRWEEKPNKNEYSHVHDALQYAFLGGGEGVRVLRGDFYRPAAPEVEVDYAYFGGAA